MVVAVCTHAHTEATEEDCEGELQAREGKHSIRLITPPNDKDKWQEYQIFDKRLHRRKFDNIAKASAILHRHNRCAQKGEDGKEYHRHGGKGRTHTNSDLKEEHTTHHQLRTTQPYREYHNNRLEKLKTVCYQIVIHTKCRTPRIHRLYGSGEDKCNSNYYTAEVCK